MLKDIPYTELTQKKMPYEIMLLYDQLENTYSDIARKYGLTYSGVIQIYNRIKIKQAKLYINHIAVVMGHKDTSKIKKIYYTAWECYKTQMHACAYLEKIYGDILSEYRAGEPGTSKQLIKSLPPLKQNLSNKTIARLIEMRESQKLSFKIIAKKLNITQARAREVYNFHYHKKLWPIIMDLIAKAKNEEEQKAIWDYYFMGRQSSPKKQYDLLTNNDSLF